MKFAIIGDDVSTCDGDHPYNVIKFCRSIPTVDHYGSCSIDIVGPDARGAGVMFDDTSECLIDLV